MNGGGDGISFHSFFASIAMAPMTAAIGRVELSIGYFAVCDVFIMDH